MKKLMLFVVLAIALVLPAAGQAQELTSEHLEMGLRVLKCLPIQDRFGIPDEQVAQIDLQHPDLVPWCAFVDEMIFVEQSEVYTKLWYNLAVVAWMVENGSTVSAQVLFDNLLASEDYQLLLLHFSILLIEA